MPVGAVIGSAVVGAGATAYAADKSNKAAKNAANATQAAADASTAEAARQYDQTRADYAPWRAVGQGALSQLASQYGITIPSTEVSATGTQPASAPAQAAAPQPGQPDWKAVLADRPDVAAAVNDPNGGFKGATPEERAADWYARYGKPSGYQLPVVPAPASQPNGIATQVSGAGPALPPRQDYTRPTTTPRPTMTRPTTAPLDISLASYEASPDLQFQLDAARKGTEAGARASGSLQSGAAAKALQDRAQNIAYGDFNNWVDRQIRIFDTANARSDANYNFDSSRSDSNYAYDTNRLDNIFESDRAYGTDVYNQDRNYLTNRYDKRTGDLFSLAGMGTTANSAVANAGQGYQNALSDGLFSTAAAQGKASQQVAANNNQAIGNILGIGTGLATTFLNSPSAYKTIPVNNATVSYAPPTPVTAYRPSNILA